MTKLTKLAAFAVVLAVTATATAADDKVDNPVYKSWAKFKPGTTVVQKVTTEINKTVQETSTTIKLVEVKKDEVVVEETAVIKVDGKELKGPAMNNTYPRQVTSVGRDPRKAKPNGTKEEGKKKVKVGDTEFECDWVKVTGRVLTEEWYLSDEVPGGWVKVINKTDTSLDTSELTSVIIKK